MYALKSPEFTPMSEAEYLALPPTEGGRYEYRRGRVYAMTGGTYHHAIITVNLSTQLNLLLSETDCAVASPDMRIHIAGQEAYRYPDISVICGPPVYLPGRTDTITNPVALVEVLSPSSALLDHNDKLAEYTQIASVNLYLLVAQDRARVERYQRHDNGEWLYAAASGLEAEIALPPLGITLALANLYRRVAWDEAEG
jgi:Uma2 family endonuclease